MQRLTRSATLLALSTATLASLPALAADELHYNQISLRAEANREVARDLMIVTADHRLAGACRTAFGKLGFRRPVQADRRPDADAENGQHELRHFQDAVDAFKARAQIATEALGGKSYKIVNLNLTSGGYPQPYARAPMMMKAAEMDSAPTPQIEAGTSEVKMSADGVIEVLQ